jgi:hypothetical protein
VFSFPVGVIGEADTRFSLRGWHFSVRHPAVLGKSGRSLTQLQRQMLSSNEEIALPKQLFQRQHGSQNGRRRMATPVRVTSPIHDDLGSYPLNSCAAKRMNLALERVIRATSVKPCGAAHR